MPSRSPRRGGAAAAFGAGWGGGRPPTARATCPLIGAQLALEPGPGQVHAYRGRCADRVLERRAGPGPGVRAGPCVQEQQGAIAPALLLPPHPELAAAGGGPPVHLAQLIAVPVGARHHVVLPGGGRGTGPAAALAVPTPSEGGPREWRDRRGNDQAAVLGERVAELHQPEGIRYPHPEWADGEVAPGAGFDGVPELAGTALLNPLKHEPGPGAQRVGNGVLGQQQPGRQPGDVLQAERDGGMLPGGYARRSDGAEAADPVAGPAGGQGREQR